MDDSELEAIRQRKMQELMAQQEDAKMEAKERRQLMLNHILFAQARERLVQIALVKADKAKGVDDVVLRAAQMGQITEKVSEEKFISLLKQINDQTSKQTKVTIQRRRNVLEDDD
ncbi:DNA-binding protein DDB_G0278111-like [Dioscorea cayenensis subsp. rotundata]|uniref:DNA-binding protein DDB_G0278111-like n=1 Tax=Dioscorea cayennensis subsp. rotundata TaxID=55577 RepID=A0AB40C2K7_DIOCR|nr:DNA-binding protein DDB_G0278111-like [Dioscorea cayenensis subsp. rotundata]